MKLLKLCFGFLFMAICFSACEVQGDVVDIVDGTPSNASKVLPDKFNKHAEADSVHEVNQLDLMPEFRK